MKRCAPPSRRAWVRLLFPPRWPSPALEAGLLQQIDFRLPERTFHVLTHRERYASHAAQAFLKMLNTAPGAKRRNEKKS